MSTSCKNLIFLALTALAPLACGKASSSGNASAIDSNLLRLDSEQEALTSDQFCSAEPNALGGAEVCPGIDSSHYQPRNPAANAELWAGCTATSSNPNTYEPFDSSAVANMKARMANFEKMAKVLWRVRHLPARKEFRQMGELFDGKEGFDDLVQEQIDITVNPNDETLAETGKCQDDNVMASHGEWCSGRKEMRPGLKQGFARGGKGENKAEQLGKMEAHMVWFLLQATNNQIIRCVRDKRSCDNAWALLTGGQQRAQAQGLGHYIQGLSDEHYQQAFDALLAARCWREQDSTPRASNAVLAAIAIDQMFIQLTHGAAVLLRAKAAQIQCSKDKVQAIHLAFAKTFGQHLAKALERSTAKSGEEALQQAAARIKEAVAQLTGESASAQALIDALDAYFVCY